MADTHQERHATHHGGMHHHPKPLHKQPGHGTTPHRATIGAHGDHKKPTSKAKEKPKSGGLVSDGSWRNFLKRGKKQLKVTPGGENDHTRPPGAGDMSPYEVHDGYGAKQQQDNQVNADGTYFQKGGLQHTEKKGKWARFRRQASSGFNISGESQTAQERTACLQILGACFFCIVFFVVLGFILYPVMKDLEYGSNAFWAIIGIIAIALVICKKKSDDGYNIFEIVGGRPGGSVG